MFRELAVKEPRLNEIKTQVRAGELGPRMHRLDEYIERHKLLSERLHGLVGPGAESNDLALRSYFAQINVRDYLLRVR